MEKRTWFVTFEYEIDGNKYTGTTYSNKYEENVGDTIKADVFKNSKGKYEVVDISNSKSLGLKNILMYISIVVGAFFLFVGIFMISSSLKKIKELEKQIQTSEQNKNN